MMSEWKKVSVSDLGRIVTGKTPKTAISEYYGGCIPFLTPSDDMSVKYVLSTSKTITEDGKNSVKNAVIPKNSICVSCIGSDLGKVVITTKETVTNQQINSVIVNTELYDVDFVYYAMVILGKVLNYHSKTSTAVPIVNKSTFSQYEILCPVLSEQRKIARILSEIDSKIAINTAINENLFQQITALYNELISSTELDEVSFAELCNFQEGYVNPAQTHPEFFDGEVKWLRAVDINESFIIDTSRTLTKTGFESAKKSALLFEPNTIAISKSGTIGRLGIIADYMCGNRAVINIRPKNKKMLPYIYSYLKSKQSEFDDLAVGSVQKNLYVSLLEPLVVSVPEQTTLDDFCDRTNSILSMIHNNCVMNRDLAAIRDTLLPKLMNREIDVSAVKI